MTIRNHRDFWSGVMFVVFGALFVVWSTDYAFGSAQRMGPGYFPTVLGFLLIVIGLMVGLSAISRSAVPVALEPVGWRGLIVVLAAVALYAYLLPRAGFLIALALLVLVSAAGSKEFNRRETLISVVVLAIASYLVFVKGLDLQFSVWPTFLH
ncbi:MAG: tripartite tricarboxylate transporter TctB family protein [Lautropia sp.]